jgi:putative hydrolase of the HAD superfamily
MTFHGTPISAVLFDYGLVLSGPPDPQSWEKMKGLLRSSEEDFHAAYWRHRHDYDQGVLNGTTYWQAVSRDVNSSLDKALLHDLIDADTALWTQPNEAMIDWAARLQSAGFKTGILSNLGDEMENGVRRKFAWLTDFAHHTFSHRLGIAKPDAAIYLHAAEGLGVAPQEILFIDDREENIEAAVVAGMNAIQYADHASFISTMRERGFGKLLNV